MKSEKKSKSTLRHKIYSYLREQIIRNEIKPKERIYEKDIMSIFNSSITPVREAILKLTSEGFIEINEYRHPIVKGISFEEYMKILELLNILSHYAYDILINEITDKQIQELESIVPDMDPTRYSSDYYDEFLDKYHNFFIKLFSCLKNEFLYKLLKSLLEDLDRGNKQNIFLIWSTMPAPKRPIKYCKKLLEAFRNKDTALLKKLKRFDKDFHKKLKIRFNM